LSYQNINCTFAVVYRPPPSERNGLNHADFNEEIQDFLIETSTQAKNLFVLGDFNIHVNNLRDKSASDFNNMLKSFNLTQHVNQPTHQLGNTLDLVITNTGNDAIQAVNVENNHLSDHHSVVVTLNATQPERQQKLIKFRKIRSIDVGDFNGDIQKDLDNDKCESMTPDENVNFLNKTLSRILEKHAPLREKKITIRPNCLWFDDNVQKLKIERRKAEKIWRISKKDEDKKSYVRLRNETNKAIADAKTKFIRNNIKENKSNPKALFNILNGLLGRDQTKTSTSPTTREDDNILSNNFGSYFTEKIEKIRNELDQFQNHTYVDETTRVNPNSSKLIEFHATTNEEIVDVINKSPSKSCDLDPLPTILLKRGVDYIAPSLTTIVNQSFKSGVVPSSYKEAHVSPLLKKPSLDKDELKNYRPVSNLNFMSKVMEKVVARRLHQHIATNNLTTTFQSAYKTGHSTETALLRVQNDIISALHNKNNVILLLLDLSAAFDTIDHKILLYRLKTKFSVTGSALTWIENYLTNRTMRVNINGSLSKPFELNFGVPQGSVLGPILFTLYTSPLEDIINKHGVNFHLYADDTQLYISVDKTSITSSRTKIEECVLELRNWMSMNKLRLNDDKTELITFHKDKTEIFIDSVQVGHTLTHRVCNVRNLGFIFDENLHLKDYVMNLCKTVQFQIHIISQIRHLLDECTTATLVHALVTSRIDYCNSLLFGLPKSTMNKIQKLQNRAARIIRRSKLREHITPILISLHWLPIEARVEFKVACLAYKCVHGTAPEYLRSLVAVRVPPRTLRSSGAVALEQKICRTGFSSRAFTFAAPAVWNKLSAATRSISSFTCFRSSLKTELFKRYYNL